MTNVRNEREALSIERPSETSNVPRAFLRIRYGSHDTHYREGIIPAATILQTFGDCIAQIGVRTDSGVYPWLAGWEAASFMQTVYVDDYVEVRAWLLTKGNRSRRYGCEMHRVMGGDYYSSRVIDPPELVAEGICIGVVPKETVLGED